MRVREAITAFSGWEADVRILLVHPSVLLYSELFLRLESLGLQPVATLCAPGPRWERRCRRAAMLFRTDPADVLLDWLTDERAARRGHGGDRARNVLAADDPLPDQLSPEGEFADRLSSSSGTAASANAARSTDLGTGAPS